MSYRVKESFAAIGPDRIPRSFRAGQVLKADHWAVKGREALLESTEEAAERTARFDNPPVEQATAEPGEKRSVRRQQPQPPPAPVEPKPQASQAAQRVEPPKAEQ